MGQSVLFDLAVGRFAWINCLFDRFDLGVDVRLNVDLFAFLAVHDVEERTAATHVLCQGAE